MIDLVDTSVWIDVLRDKNGRRSRALRNRIGEETCILTRFTQLELLQGARNESEWKLLDDYLSSQYYEAAEGTWREAARTYFELRRKGTTLTTPIDCCIAQIAMEWGVILLHRDRDFEKIAGMRPLAEEYFVSA